MTDIINVLKRKKLQFFFLFYVLLILPLLSPLAQNLSVMQVVLIILANVLLFASIFLVSVFMSPKTEKIIYAFILVISILPGTILLGYLLFADVLLEKNSVTSLFETNPEESKEFLVYYLNTWVVLGVSLYAMLPAAMIALMRSVKKIQIKKHPKVFAASLIVILSVVSIPQLSQSVYFISFYSTFVSYRIQLYEENKGVAARQSKPYEVESIVNDTMPQTIVVVIGESLNRSHMQIYGYGRATTPLLAARGDSLHIYRDVISPQVHTIPVMRSLLSFYDSDCFDCLIDKPSLFELFNRAGYETYFIGNQPFGGSPGTSYDLLLNVAKHKFDLASENKHDEVVLSTLGEVLKTQTDKNKFIVIHLIGNHMAYKFRYPPQYQIFDNRKDWFTKNTTYINQEAQDIIDEYDNSVLYNDFVVNQIMDKLARSGDRKSAMLYFSDHGEEMYDFRPFAGHAYEKVSAYMCQIPFVLWFSDSFQKGRTDLEIDTDRPYSTTDFIYSISNLAGLNYIDYDEKRSVFSKQFEPRERYVGEIPYRNLTATTSR